MHRHTPLHQGDRGGGILKLLGIETVILNNGLDVIGERAFRRCALVCIDILPLLRAINSKHSVSARG